MADAPVTLPTIRHAFLEDRRALYRVCLETGDSGQDATPLYQDPDLLGHIYAGPYAALAPEFAFVLEDAEGVAGYVIGALDTREFEARLEREWWPALRARYPMTDALRGKPREERTPDERLVALLHSPGRAEDEVVAAYPSHLHIDLLPRAQGGGNGRRLMTTLLRALRDAGSPGVHLGVGARNTNAIGFYRHYGFKVLREHPWGLTMGHDLRGR
ncbi:GNAT family N-acetyltransferase [Deinococcus pimensis]|uniref:GNAT family N-acetyltransferase n=1 Tax=Deinococcus pimensis TaxID=309888 RepID=UPI000486C016|nr:GNAT family N-acetyltransferase [Deinococcus pimensis]